MDCLGKQLRLTIARENQKLIKLLARDAGHVVVAGTGDRTRGPQTPRHVVVEYYPKLNAKLGTAGEVATIEFR